MAFQLEELTLIYDHLCSLKGVDGVNEEFLSALNFFAWLKSVDYKKITKLSTIFDRRYRWLNPVPQ